MPRSTSSAGRIQTIDGFSQLAVALSTRVLVCVESMYLSEFQIFSYKSFLGASPIRLRPGFNVLTGKNNAGKTALLEALGLRFQSKPHRSLKTAPKPGAWTPEPSRALFSVAVTLEELKSIIQRPNAGEASILVPRDELTRGADITSLWKNLSRSGEVEIKVAYAAGGNETAPIHPPNKVFKEQFSTNSNHIFLLVQQSPDGRFSIGQSLEDSSNTGRYVGNQFRQNIYSFRAERMRVGRSAFGNARELQSDASNLPEVLNVLQSTNPERFRRYNQMVRRVFSEVEWVNVHPVDSHTVEILVWSVDPATERADLAVPLTESGTGISQVLAMLYVLVTSETARTILIDEPNSFLHPGAVRSLVEILKEHPQHQYIISTHSPELIAASNPSTIHLLRRTEGVTSAQSIDTTEAQNLRTLLLEVGSRFSDVFGAESILWVEGPTEQLCFPLIVRRVLGRSLAGVSIIGVLHTGDFDAKSDTRSVFRIYERLTTQGSALLPPAMAFIFDRELRPDKDRQDLERQSKGKVHFIGRRTYENYLLHPDAIAAILNNCRPFTEEGKVLVGTVQTWLDQHIQNPKYFGRGKPQNNHQDIDAPRLLDDLFHELSANRLAYNKVEHSVALTEWLIVNSPEALRDISELLAQVLPS